MGGVVAPAGDEVGQDHHADAEQDARHGPCQEQGADRDLRQDAVEDQGDGWRDDGSDRAGGGRDGGGEVFVVAVLLHGRDEHPADRAGIGHGRAGDAGEEHRRLDVHQRQSTAQPPDEFHREVDQPLGDAAGAHERAGQHEERHGEERERVCAGEHAAGEQHQAAAAGEHRHDGGDGQDEGDRQAEEQQHREHQQHQERDGERRRPAGQLGEHRPTEAAAEHDGGEQEPTDGERDGEGKVRSGPPRAQQRLGGEEHQEHAGKRDGGVREAHRDTHRRAQLRLVALDEFDAADRHGEPEEQHHGSEEGLQRRAFARLEARCQ